MLSKELLRQLYVRKGKSMQEIADINRCSVHKTQYWMQKYGIKRRSMSDAMYQKHNPDGDPFRFIAPRTHKDWMLYGLGLGLYWGEGTRSNRMEVRLGNTDPALIHIFLTFLQRFFDVKKNDFRFGLQVFSDMNPKEALDFWCRKLRVRASQFYQVVVTQSGSIGTYRNKNRTGVLTIHYHNKKFRDLLIAQLAAVAQG